MKLSATLVNPQQAKPIFDNAWLESKGFLIASAGSRLHMSIIKETRSIAQNKRMWAMLKEVSKQVDWYGRKLTDTEWKHVFSAALQKQDVVPGLEGGFVVLGQSTSQMTIAEMNDLMTLMEAFGAQKNVRFSAPDSWQGMDQ